MAKRLGQPKTTAPKKEQFKSIAGLDQAAAALDAPISDDSGETTVVPWDEVKPDEHNPRRLGLTWEILISEEPLEDARLQAEVEEIKGLAKTFNRVGQRSPCEIYRAGAFLKIVTGERRYWAAGLRHYWATGLSGGGQLKVTILRKQPDNVPLVQLIENIQRSNLPLYETLRNVEAAITIEQDRGRLISSVAEFIDLTGMTRSRAYEYWHFLQAPKDIWQYLEQRIITTKAELQTILDLPNAKERAVAVRCLQAGQPLAAPASLPPTNTPARRGRPRTRVALGNTENVNLVRFLVERTDPQGDYGETDWQDLKVVNEVWKRLLMKLEKQLMDNG